MSLFWHQIFHLLLTFGLEETEDNNEYRNI